MPETQHANSNVSSEKILTALSRWVDTSCKWWLSVPLALVVEAMRVMIEVVVVIVAVVVVSAADVDDVNGVEKHTSMQTHRHCPER